MKKYILVFLLALTMNFAAKAQSSDLATATGQLYNSIANPNVGTTTWTNKVVNQEFKGIDLVEKGDEAYSDQKYKKALKYYNNAADHFSTSAEMYKEGIETPNQPTSFYKKELEKVQKEYDDVLNKISLTNKMLSGGH